MRRAPIVLTATVAGTAGVLAFHPHSPVVRPATASTASTPAATATPTKRAGGTATGDPVDTQYGPAQVRVTVKDGKITAVQAVELQSGDPRSQAISAYAEPILRQEVLSAQTAAVDAVSGATYTSESYLQSAQSALDRLGFKATA
jgi:uncharacterized protein with FMN-binding domain